MTLSKNGAGFAALVVVIFSIGGIDISVETINDAMTSIATLASLGLMAWNQWSRPDVKTFFFKV